MCRGFAREFTLHCKCLWFYEEPELCDPFITFCQREAYDYRFKQTLCTRTALFRKSFCIVTTVGPDKPMLAIIGVERDPLRTPYRMMCTGFVCDKLPVPHVSCPLHDPTNRTVPMLGDLLVTPWLNVEIIGHQITPHGMFYLRWEHETGGTRTWVKAEEVDANATLSLSADRYHAKRKRPGEETWPPRWAESWPARLKALREDEDASKRMLVP